MPLTLQEQISYVKQIPVFGRHLAVGLQRIEDAVNTLGVHTGSDPTGTMPPPTPIQMLTVKASNGLVHAVITHNLPTSRPIHYFVEYDTDPSFPQPHVAHLGASRSMQPITLPAKNDGGSPQNWYFRAYNQYPGGDPSAPIAFGGTTPSPVNVGGSGQLTLIPSTGSGSAKPTGQQGGSGFGKVLHRNK